MTPPLPTGAAAAASDHEALAAAFAQLSLDAAVAIMAVYSTRGCAYRAKADKSPVSEADEEAEVVILAGLQHCAPGVPVLAEEAAARGIRPEVDGRFILVDPVDGTKEFISGSGEFTVNIALIEAGRPVVGVVYAPALGRLWVGSAAGAFACEALPGGTFDPAALAPIHVRPQPAAGLVALASRSHGDAETESFLARLDIAERQGAGSSLKFCRVAEGAADVYPRFGPTMEWDTAAGDAVLRAAGGIVLAAEGGPLAYGKSGADFRNGAFVAWGEPASAIPARPEPVAAA